MFEIVKEYKDKGINIPVRATKGSAGYDIQAAEDVVVPSLFKKLARQIVQYSVQDIDTSSPLTIEEVKKFVKEEKLRTLIPTGLKVKLEKGYWLALVPRSGTGTNCLLKLANGIGVIDEDYYNNNKNEGHFFIPMINLSPYDILIKKGEAVAQAIILPYGTFNDVVNNVRNGGFGSTGVNIPLPFDNCVDPRFSKELEVDCNISEVSTELHSVDYWVELAEKGELCQLAITPFDLDQLDK